MSRIKIGSSLDVKSFVSEYKEHNSTLSAGGEYSSLQIICISKPRFRKMDNTMAFPNYCMEELQQQSDIIEAIVICDNNEDNGK